MIAALTFVSSHEVEAIMFETFKMAITIQSLIILRIPTLVGVVETHLKGYLFLHSHYEICFILGIYGEIDRGARSSSCQPSSRSWCSSIITSATTVLRCKSKVNSNIG